MGFLVLAAPLYALFSVRMAISLCALLVIAVAVAGLLRFGFAQYTLSFETEKAKDIAG